MSGFQVSQNQIFNTLANAPGWLVFGFSGEPQAHLGGLGGEANQKFYRRVVPPALLARTCFTPFFSHLISSIFPTSSASPFYFSDYPFTFPVVTVCESSLHQVSGFVCVTFEIQSVGEPLTDCAALGGSDEQWAQPERGSGLCKSVSSRCPVTTEPKGVCMIQSPSKAMQPGRRPWVRAVFSFAATAALPVFAACSSTCLKHETVARVLDEQGVMLDKLKVERADTRVSTKVQADPDLKAAEEHLNMVIDMMMRSSGAVKAAL